MACNLETWSVQTKLYLLRFEHAICRFQHDAHKRGQHIEYTVAELHTVSCVSQDLRSFSYSFSTVAPRSALAEVFGTNLFLLQPKSHLRRSLC